MRKLLIQSLRAIMLSLALTSLSSSEILAQYEVTGQFDVVIRNTSSDDVTNKTFKDFSNFDFIRARLFFDAQVADDATVFTQVLIDNSKFQLYGAYLRLSELAGPGLNLHVGLIPNTVGLWGPRTYSNRNPLIGTPLIYNYHSALSLAEFQSTPQALHEFRGKGYTAFGLPMLYDACWNTGIDIFGSVGMIDWSVAALSGAVSSPSIQREKDIPQITGKVAFYFSPMFTITLSGFAGPYLRKDADPYSDGFSGEIEDYLNLGGGIGAQYASGYLQLFGEAFVSRWEHPYLGNLDAYGGYVDGKYKLAPQWFVAGRVETIRFSEMDFGPELGKMEWDYPLNRFETGIGYNFNRNVTIKLVGQIVVSPDEDTLDDETIAVQFATEI